MLKPGAWLAIAARFVCVAAGLGATVGTIASISGFSLPRPRWSELIPPQPNWQASWLRIRVGMTREQVVAVLGPPVMVSRDVRPVGHCVDIYGYPDYSNEVSIRDLCFDATGRLSRTYESRIRFDLREMVDGSSLQEQVPGVALFALLGGVFFGLAAIVSMRAANPRAGLGIAHGVERGGRRTSASS